MAGLGVVISCVIVKATIVSSLSQGDGNVKTSCWLWLPDDMIDNDGLWGHQEGMKTLRNLRKLHPLGLKDLPETTKNIHKDQFNIFRIFNFLEQNRHIFLLSRVE